MGQLKFMFNWQSTIQPLCPAMLCLGQESGFLLVKNSTLMVNGSEWLPAEGLW